MGGSNPSVAYIFVNIECGVRLGSCKMTNTEGGYFASVVVSALNVNRVLAAASLPWKNSPQLTSCFSEICCENYDIPIGESSAQLVVSIVQQVLYC